MNGQYLKPWPLAAAIAAIIAGAGFVVAPATAGSVVITDGPVLGASAHTVLNNRFNGEKARYKARYIVSFNEAPLALYSGDVPGLAAAPHKAQTDGRNKLDSHSLEAVAYVAYVKNKQNEHLNAISSAIGDGHGHNLPTVRRMQYALNAVVVDLTPEQARLIKDVPGVKTVDRDEIHQPASDIGPGFIGAKNLWFGTSGGVGADTIFKDGFEGPSSAGALGDGVVVGDIDTGYNSASPSFTAIDETGYEITNPLGDGNFIGDCAVADISVAGCNNKVIGVYDMINATPTSVEDAQSHGSHTASTAAGNIRSSDFGGYMPQISGVAPHANLVIFYACDPSGCPTSATSASVDQAIQDGLVDVLNYSISGGGSPWSQVTSRAFLAAQNAGIFVAAAAGNTGAGVDQATPGSANHLEPWVTTVAASTHTGGAVVNFLNVDGGPQESLLQQASGDNYTGSFSTAIPDGTPIIVSPDFKIDDMSGSDGCTAYPTATFDNAIALISRGSCAFSIKALNAQDAGAVAIVISDNRPEDLFAPNLVTAAITVPTWLTTQADGQAIDTYVSANPGAVGGVPYDGMRLPTQPDVLADFSLLGPSSFDLVKPDVEAPGVNILAAYANDGSADGADKVGLLSGTSMATPHTTGAGALLVERHPDWTAMEIKSALMMTAKEAGLTKPDATTASDFFDRGSGRIQVDIADKAGLVMDESGTNFLGVDPALGGDDPASLNLASMQNSACLTVTSMGTEKNCSFTRKFRGTQGQTVTWTASVTGDISALVSPSSFAVSGPGVKTVNIEVDSSAYASDGNYHFGEVVLTPSDTSLPDLHLPLAVAIPEPNIEAASELSITIPASASSASSNLEIDNTGGPTLVVTDTNFQDAGPAYAYVTLDQPSQGNNGFYSSFFTNYHMGSYVSDDFTTRDPLTDLSVIEAPGFSTGLSLSSLTGHMVHFEIYGDDSGLPDGAPETTASSNAVPIWSFNATIGTTPGLDVDGDTIRLNLDQASASATALPPGTYWVTVYPEINLTTQGGWALFASTVGHGNPLVAFGPVFGDTDWAPDSEFPGLALHLEQKVACGAPWLTTSPSTLSIDGLSSDTVAVTADSTQFASGTSVAAYLCIQSNDADEPIHTVRVEATQN